MPATPPETVWSLGIGMVCALFHAGSHYYRNRKNPDPQERFLGVGAVTSTLLTVTGIVYGTTRLYATLFPSNTSSTSIPCPDRVVDNDIFVMMVLGWFTLLWLGLRSYISGILGHKLEE